MTSLVTAFPLMWEGVMAKRALLIGINKYQIDGADLRGCVNDVEDVSSALVDCYGFKKSDIAVLTDFGRNEESDRRPASRRCCAIRRKAMSPSFITPATVRTCLTTMATNPTAATKSSARPIWTGTIRSVTTGCAPRSTG